MTLDPVHFDGITSLAGRVTRAVAEQDHRAFAETVWQEFLDPLVDDGVTVLEPLDEVRRRRAAVEDAALQDPPFATRHGLDSGTINPTTFRNGLTLDVAQAAMSAVPSDLDLHRARTVVITVHSNDATATFDEEWTMWDDGYTRGRVLHTPRVDQYETAVVHELALYLAESHHALTQAEVVDDLLVLDGPVYPKGLLNWARREPELADLLTEERPRDVVANYVRLVETFVERDVPLLGFVKSPVTRAVTRTVRKRRGNAPWVNDAAFFSQVLERRVDGERDTDHLTLTNWFRSRGGADRVLSTAGDALGIERDLPAAAYEVCFFMLYDPREDNVYRVETPAAFATDPDLRERLVRQVLAGVAAERGPPLAVAKADDLGRIGQRETAALRDAIEEILDAEEDTSYGEDRERTWLSVE
ncbi:MAG: DNA double-strand break repair nuclease NurA [Haloarculaceae archaeon]